MSLQTLLIGTTLLVALLFSSACVSTVERRIERNPQIFGALSEQDQSLVMQRRLREGMNKDAVFLILGKPDRVAQGRRDGKSFERWTYMGQRAVTTQTFGMGFGGWGGVGACGPWGDPFWGAGPMVTYIPYDAAAVDFVNNRVTGWEQSPMR